ncbi:MAG: MmgE/PrpD family protein [Chloroflexota bacterium]|nr:MmgE/PrpD family protein [Chloroflexota bacterium]MDE2685623.1 MmgE/PrpD family protein [Chloroflexota bacterium]
MNITRRIAEFVTASDIEDFPPDAIEAAKAAIMDCLACMLAGSGESLSDILCRYVAAESASPAASVVGRGFRTSAANAALVNGAMGHALDYDDITQVTKTHPTTVLLPAALAIAEEAGASGKDLLLGYLTGFEVACAVGEALSEAYYDDLGWHPTGPLGAVGAAAAASKIMALDPERTAMAVSLAASQASGLRQNFGTMTKPFHAGDAARAGVVAAKLVRDGFTASDDALEGRFGFIRAFSGGEGFDSEQVAQNLGNKLYMVDSGIEIKKYPCCGSAHLALDATFDLLSQSDIDPDAVDRIDVMVDFDPPRSLIHSRPLSSLEGKFSIQYCLAAALLDQRVGLQSFTDDQVMRPEAQALIPRIDMRRIPGNEGQPSWTEGYHQVDVQLKDGSILRQQAHRANSGALRGVTMDDVREKFRDCASLLLSDATTAEILSRLDSLEEGTPITGLTNLLRA